MNAQNNNNNNDLVPLTGKEYAISLLEGQNANVIPYDAKAFSANSVCASRRKIFLDVLDRTVTNFESLFGASQKPAAKKHRGTLQAVAMDAIVAELKRMGFFYW